MLKWWDALVVLFGYLTLILLLNYIAPNNIVFDRLGIKTDVLNFFSNTGTSFVTIVSDAYTQANINTDDDPIGAFVIWIIGAVQGILSAVTNTIDMLQNIPIVGPFFKLVGWLTGATLLLLTISGKSIGLLVSPSDPIDFVVGVSFLPLTLYMIVALIQLVLTIIKSLPVIGSGGET